MIKVLILNHQHIECGVYQIGERIFNIAVKSKKVSYEYRVVKSWIEYKTALSDVKPDYVIYNYHWDRMPWLQDSDITGNRDMKHYFIYHDGSMMKVFDKYLVFGSLPPKVDADKAPWFQVMPRPLYRFDGNYRVNDVVNVGSFGFAFNHKKFHTIAPFVGSQFEQAVVNLHFTNPYFGDTEHNKIADIVNLCHRNCPANVKLNITNNFTNDNGVLQFLANNDLNLFVYDTSIQNPGISSAIDYALSVRRPIAVSDNMMFRHISSKDIMVEHSKLKDIINRGTVPLEPFYREWSPEKFSTAMDNLFV